MSALLAEVPRKACGSIEKQFFFVLALVAEDPRKPGGRFNYFYEIYKGVFETDHIGIALWTFSFWVRACEMYIGISFLGVPQADDGSESDRKAKRSSGARGRRPRQGGR